MNKRVPAASIMLQIGLLTIGNIVVVTTWSVMLMFLLPCSLSIPPADIDWLNSTQRSLSFIHLKVELHETFATGEALSSD